MISRFKWSLIIGSFLYHTFAELISFRAPGKRARLCLSPQISRLPCWPILDFGPNLNRTPGLGIYQQHSKQVFSNVYSVLFKRIRKAPSKHWWHSAMDEPGRTVKIEVPDEVDDSEDVHAEVCIHPEHHREDGGEQDDHRHHLDELEDKLYRRCFDKVTCWNKIKDFYFSWWLLSGWRPLRGWQGGRGGGRGGGDHINGPQGILNFHGGQKEGWKDIGGEVAKDYLQTWRPWKPSLLGPRCEQNGPEIKTGHGQEYLERDRQEPRWLHLLRGVQAVCCQSPPQSDTKHPKVKVLALLGSGQMHPNLWKGIHYGQLSALHFSRACIWSPKRAQNRGFQRTSTFWLLAAFQFNLKHFFYFCCSNRWWCLNFPWILIFFLCLY